ncbi:hypothetical protein [Clostridium sp.]|uniref:hypothetical protein n=1 Tax=Clostridium sp. TaxID=1506 RepID=UPI00260BFB41|nr:hypothetical protein [uncultured Clostridium sp.]
MLTEQDIMNNAFKDMLFHEENMAIKYAYISEQITDPKLQKILKGLEQGVRNHHRTLLQTMSKFSIV